MEVTEPLLFLRYAIPCARVLVSRGVITQSFLDGMTDDVSNGIQKKEYISTFKTALAMMRAIAKERGKTGIDAEVIRSYFLDRHNELLPSLAKSDVPQELCRVRTGKVTGSGEFLTVKTELGDEKVKSTFTPDAKPGDTVSVHYDFACEVLERASRERRQK